ncbi:GNAT family protein, partial [Kocuria sp.]|uniref:GNAT family N-acetyltransferase n=1 Tax=Kocuria sp. TaxID=1871328 RepID=UPI002896E8F1
RFGDTLVSAARGLGFATQALYGLLRIARSQGERKFRASTHIDNYASQRVLERSGLRITHHGREERYFEISRSR